jgi:hypothetical protein
MSPPPTSIDGTEITGATIDGTDVQEITVDGQTVFSAGPDIPDSALSHEHLASSLSAADGDPVSTWDDDEGGDPLTNGSAVYRDSAFNGNPTLEFDTDAAGFDGDLTTELQPPFSVWIVVEITSLDGQEYVMPFERADSAGILYRDDKDETRFYGDNANSGASYSWQSSDPLDQYILGYVADGADSIGFLNNSTVSGFTVDNSLDTFSIGSNTADDRRLKGYIPHVLIYDRATTGSFADSIISSLKNIHGVSF